MQVFKRPKQMCKGKKVNTFKPCNLWGQICFYGWWLTRAIKTQPPILPLLRYTIELGQHRLVFTIPKFKIPVFEYLNSRPLTSEVSLENCVEMKICASQYQCNFFFFHLTRSLSTFYIQLLVFQDRCWSLFSMETNFLFL